MANCYFDIIYFGDVSLQVVVRWWPTGDVGPKALGFQQQ